MSEAVDPTLSFGWYVVHFYVEDFEFMMLVIFKNYICYMVYKSFTSQVIESKMKDASDDDHSNLDDAIRVSVLVCTFLSL